VLDRTDIIYLYDGSFDGFLTAIFIAFFNKERPMDIVVEYEPGLFTAEKTIMTNERHSSRVISGILAKIGDEAYHKVYYAYLSQLPGSGAAALDYLRLAFKVGREAILRQGSQAAVPLGGRSPRSGQNDVYDLLFDDRVLKINKIAKLVGTEKTKLIEFVRFAELDNGVLFSEITPNYNTVPLLMPHFCERLNTIPFVIHDKNRNIAGVYNLKEWYMIDSADIQLPENTIMEKEYQKMWRKFYDTIAIKERHNPRCRRNFMPKYYWRNMVEVKEAQ